MAKPLKQFCYDLNYFLEEKRKQLNEKSEWKRKYFF